MSLATETHTAVLRVRDTGRGIPRDLIDHVFSLFGQIAPTLDRTAGGLGLGLTLARQLIELHHGTRVTSDGSDHGSEFVVRLPLA